MFGDPYGKELRAASRSWGQPPPIANKKPPVLQPQETECYRHHMNLEADSCPNQTADETTALGNTLIKPYETHSRGPA